MTFTFTPEIPRDLLMTPELISGIDSRHFDEQEFLIVTGDDKSTRIFEIRYNNHCSPFKQAMIEGAVLAVGFEEYFYMFDLESNLSLLQLKINGYFSSFHFDRGVFYVADAYGLHCIDKKGNLIWTNAGLGVDGVIINEFNDTTISGKGEWNPPDGWKEFVLDRNTGFHL